jgi:ribosomal protein S18 acetylase RimI-like enzyme
LRYEGSVNAPGTHVLDNPVWAALGGPQTHLGEIYSNAARFDADVSPFAAVADPHDPDGWQHLAALIGPGAATVVLDVTDTPGGWTRLGELAGVQMVGEALATAPDPEACLLTADDVPAMLDLVERTKPGPFRPRTIEMGKYLGIKDNRRLVAMAGERMKPAGWTEVSAVCTDPSARGRGLATRLVRAIGHEIRQRGDVPMLHAAASNTSAIRLYEDLGFVLRRQMRFAFVRSPERS